jgi:hypothetical protein
MKERLKRPQLSIITGILKILALFAALIIISVVAASVKATGFSEYYEYIAFALFAVMCFIVITRLLTEYSYTVDGGYLIVEKYVFSQPKCLLRMKLSEISYIGRYLPRAFVGKRLNATYKKSGVVFIVYGSGDNRRCATLSPSKKMLDLITAGKSSEELHDK